MCGIAGVLQSRGAADRELVQRLAGAMVHRGPDDEGIYCDGPVGLAFRRLAILDLSPAGHQPMLTADGRHALVFNGEIYNHLEIRQALEAGGHSPEGGWKSSSDTETLLASLVAHGIEDTLPRLQGMFALAWWDCREKTLTLARDRFGKKPLYLMRHGDGLAFASEIKTLLHHPAASRSIDPARIPAYLAYRYVPGHETLVAGVEPLPPGHWMTARLEGAVLSGEPRPWWRPEFGGSNGSAAAGQGGGMLTDDLEATDALDVLLNEAVESRLLSDVPLGAFLSGGIDSSVVVALMARLRPEQPPQTFSIGFDTGTSEHLVARKVAGLFRAKHHEIIVGSEDIRRELPTALNHREGPITEPSDVPLSMLCALARQHVTVVLSGEGSDELLAGYPKHIVARWMSPGVRSWVRPLAGLGLAFAPGVAGPRGTTLMRALATGDDAESDCAWFGAFTPAERSALLRADFLRDEDGSANRSQALDAHRFARAVTRDAGHLSALDRAQLLDCAHWLPANLLQRADRLTMGHSLELRCPFLDARLAAFAMHRLPAGMRVRGRQGKWLLKQVALRYLPREIVFRKKWGFKVPVGEWFRGDLREDLRAALLDGDSPLHQWLRPEPMRRLFDEHQSGKTDHTKRLWALWQLEQFARWLGSK
jgi:asparagine synthase (glutamine-hydrolysing)